LIWIKEATAASNETASFLRYFGNGMPTFLYRCPNTGLRVQGWIANDPTERDEDSFEAVTCPACGGVHLVNPQTGKVLGANDNGLAQQTFAIAARGGSKLSQLRGTTRSVR
jgi:hypothetical protein